MAIDMNISVIILNWNGKDLLRKCLPSVIKAVERVDGNHEIIVVDNGSIDGSVGFLESKFPEIKVLSLKKNLGISPANNIAANKANGDILVFLNNDIMLKEDSLVLMLEHFKDPRVFGVSPKLLKWDKKTIQAEFIGCHFILGTVVLTQPNMNKTDKKEFKEPRLTFFALGGASAIDKKKLLKLGGFNEIYAPFYWEEVDLSYRAYKRGWVCIYEPNAVFYHKHRATLNRAFSREELQIQELKTRFIFTWLNFYDWLILAKHFAFLPIVLLRSAFISPYRGKRFIDIMAFLRALRHWKDILRTRKKEKKRLKLSDREVLELINSNRANELAPVRFKSFIAKKDD